MVLTAEQVSVIKQTTPILQDHGIALCHLFYNNLLSENDSLNAVFSQTNQQTGAQPRALAGALLAYAQNIDNLAALSSALERVCQKHASMCVRPGQYETVGNYLLGAMAQLLGPTDFTDDVKAAWAAAYWQLANMMIKREKELYQADQEWSGWRDFVIADKVVEAEDMISVILRPTDGKPLPDYLPGQFVSVNVEVPQLGYKQIRQFSLSDKPRSDRYRISVKKERAVHGGSEVSDFLQGVVSNIIHDHMQPGDIIEVTKPRGVFFVDPSRKTDQHLALISAGSGVTPMIAIMESLLATQSRRRVSWIHVTRNSKTHAFKRRLGDFVQQMDTFRSTVIYSRPGEGDSEGLDFSMAGRVNSGALLRDAQLAGAECCICGPSSFMDDVAAELRSIGVLESNIKMELFGTGGLPEPSG